MPGGKRDQEQRTRTNSPASNTRSRSRVSNPADIGENTRNRSRTGSPADIDENTRNRSRTGSPADVDESTRSRSGTSDPPVANNERDESASERDSSGEDSVEDEEEVNESSRAGENAHQGEAATNQKKGVPVYVCQYCDQMFTTTERLERHTLAVHGSLQPEHHMEQLDPAEEIHRDLEKMLDTRIIAAENAGRIINKRMRHTKEHLNTHNLTRLKTAIDQLQTARKRVEETYKEAARHDEKKNSRDKAYAGRCHKKKTQLVLKTDKKIDKAQRLLDEKSVEVKENSPDETKKMCPNLKPTTKLSDEMTLEEQDAWFKEFLSYYTWNESVLKTRPYETRIQVLLNCISPSLVTLLSTDSTMVTDDGQFRGIEIVRESPKGNCLTKLRGYLLAENPIHLRRHKLQQYTQHEGQKFSVWWAAKLNLVKMCNLEKGLSREDMLVLELIGGVFDENLRTELIRRSGEADYEGLLKIAKNWHTSRRITKGRLKTGTRETKSRPRRTSRETWRRGRITALYAETAIESIREGSAQHGSKNATHAEG